MLYSINALAIRGAKFRAQYSQSITATLSSFFPNTIYMPLRSNLASYSSFRHASPLNTPTRVTFSNDGAYFGNFSNALIGFSVNGPPAGGIWSWTNNNISGTLDFPPTEFEGDFTIEAYILPIGLGDAGESVIATTKQTWTFGETPGDFFWAINNTSIVFKTAAGTIISINHNFGSFSGSTYKHVFLGRKDSTWWLGLDGVAVSSTNQGNFNLSQTGPLQIGYHQHYGLNQYRGYMKDLIITKNTCKYFTNSYVASTKYGLYYNPSSPADSGFFVNGIINHIYTSSTTPIRSHLDAYYIIPTPSNFVTPTNGLYSSGRILSGSLDTSYSSTIPLSTIDYPEMYVTAVSGVVTQAGGPYSNGYYISGTRNATYTSATPVQGVNGLFYTFENGIATAANGFYSNGNFTNGVRSAGFHSESAMLAIDTGKFYSATFGSIALAQGTIGGIPYSAGEVSYGARFMPGAGAYVSNPLTDFSLGTGNFTIEAYVVVVQAGGFVLCTNIYGQDGGYSLDFSYFADPGHILVYRANAGVGKLTTFNANYQLNTKFHIALVRNSGVVRLYFNGTNIAANAGTDNLTDTSFPWNPTSTTDPSVGLGTQIDIFYNRNNNPGDTWISDLRVVKGSALYTANFTPPASMSSTGATTSIVAFKTPPITRDGSSKAKTIVPSGNYFPK